MLRAWQTAEIIIDELSDRFPSSPNLNSFDALAERGVGSVANMSITDIENIVHEDPRYEALPKNWKSDSHFRLPFQGAESLLEAGGRVASHIEQRMRNLEEDSITDTVKLFVGHGAAFRHAAFHLGILDLGRVSQLSMYHAQPVLIEYQSGAGWSHTGGTWKPRRGNIESID
jgi:2,3-bisphosphoglycerate-dependent phosphoglycerate mutase